MDTDPLSRLPGKDADVVRDRRFRDRGRSLRRVQTRRSHPLATKGTQKN
jgi:hypothetical protein